MLEPKCGRIHAPEKRKTEQKDSNKSLECGKVQSDSVRTTRDPTILRCHIQTPLYSLYTFGNTPIHSRTQILVCEQCAPASTAEYAARITCVRAHAQHACQHMYPYICMPTQRATQYMYITPCMNLVPNEPNCLLTS